MRRVRPAVRPALAPALGALVVTVTAVALWGIGSPTRSAGCREPQTEASRSSTSMVEMVEIAAPAPAAEPTSVTTTLSAELRGPPRSGVIETVEVPEDRPVLVMIGRASRRPIVHLHGMCSEARSDFDAFGATVSAYGMLIALEGDTTCPRGGATWTRNAAAIDERLRAALLAVGTEHGIDFDLGAIVLVGESMGASRVLALATRFPDTYKRLVLVGGPEAPRAEALRDAHAVALLAGEREPQDKMRRGARELEGVGVAARFWEMADATHGTYGSDGARAMGEAVAFVIAE